MLMLEKQAEMIHSISPNYRIGFDDSTGGLVKIPDEPKQVMNYALVFKDSTKLQFKRDTGV